MKSIGFQFTFKFLAIFVFFITNFYSLFGFAACKPYGPPNINAQRTASFVEGTADIPDFIEIKKSDPIGTVLNKEPISLHVDLEYFCQNSTEEGRNSYQFNGVIGNGVLYKQPLDLYSSAICGTNIPGIGVQVRIANHPNYTELQWSSYNCRLNSFGPGTNGMVANNHIGMRIISGDNTGLKINLIKIGDVPDNPPPLGMLISQVMEPTAAGFPRIGFGVSTAKTIKPKNRVCSISPSSNQTVRLGKTDISTLNQSASPYSSFDIFLECEEGANLNNVQLSFDGSGTSSSEPGLITPDKSNDSAQNVFVEVTDMKGERIPFRKEVSLPNGIDTRFSMRARLVAQSGAVLPGMVKANMTVTLVQN